MKPTFTSAGIAVLLCGVAFGQATATSPVFDAADVHASAPASSLYMRGGLLPGGRYELRGATMMDLIRAAWGTDADSVYGGPSWIETDRFDIIAKTAPTSPEADRAPMLRALLADRFKLVVHNDEKPVPVFVLSMGKKRSPQLKDSDGTGDP